MNRQELIEAIDGLEVFDMSYCNGDMKHLPRKNFYINKYRALSLIDKLDDIPEGYEVLSENWIEENRLNVELTDSFNINCVVVSKLKNLFIPTQPEKVKLPKFVVDEIERAKGEGTSLNDVYRISNKFKDKLYQWLITENNDEIFARAWLDGHEAEQEQLYTVTLANGSILIKDPEFNSFQLCRAQKEQIEGYEYKLTQSEIESVDPRLMALAVEVE